MKNHSKSIAALSQPQREMIEPGRNVVVGLGDRHSQLCLLDLEGNIVERHRIRTGVASFETFFDAWAPMRVVFEAGTHSLWVWRLLQRLSHEPLMADTHQLALITHSLSKNDRRDAAVLGALGLRMPQMLHAVHPCSLQTQVDRTVPRARDGAVQARTKLINQVRGTVKSFGERLPPCTTEAFAKKASAALPSSLKDALGPLLLVIQHLSDEIRRYDKKIKQLGAEKYPHTLRMRTIPGVGPITSLAFVLNLDNDVSKLKASRAAGPRMGLRPKERSSGKRAPQLSITKSGDQMLRRLLVQGGQYTLGHFGTDSQLRRWGLGLAARGGKAAKRKAVVAVARKLAILLHVLWKRERDFDPFYGRKGEKPAAQTAAAPARPATAG